MSDLLIEEVTLPRLSYRWAKKNSVFFSRNEGSLLLNCRKDLSLLTLKEIIRITHEKFELLIHEDSEFSQKFSECFTLQAIDQGKKQSYQKQDSLDGLANSLNDLLDSSDDTPIINLINGLIAEAHRMKASDIHIETFETKMAVRMRIDGVLKEVVSIDRSYAQSLISRIKVMSRLDISERRIPQDGRMSLTISNEQFDVRVSTLPALHDERVVLRILDQTSTKVDLNSIHMPDAMLAILKHKIQSPNGMILVTGPTGSGKTTTLYACLNHLNDKKKNILTVEDPVEYSIEGVGQTQVNSKIGMSFASGLRAILRQDPDVVMVGEVRDKETAQIAIQAGLTGHLVLSTVHTNSAASALTRLKDLGIENYLIASSVRMIISQRLVRKLCKSCKAIDKNISNFYIKSRIDNQNIYKAVGCAHCENTGYKDRVAIFEMINVNDEIKNFISKDIGESELEDLLYQNNEKLMDNAIVFINAGITSVEEVLRVCSQEYD